MAQERRPPEEFGAGVCRGSLIGGKILAIAGEMGAVSVGGIHLHLRGEVRQVFMGWLRQQRPDLVPRYEQLYRKGAYAPTEERKRLSRMIHTHGRSHRFLQPRADPADQPITPSRVKATLMP